jgi:hypothetical protein
MKKVWKVAVALIVLALVLSTFDPKTTAAVQRNLWGKVEVKSNMIGKIVVLKDTSLFRADKGKPKVVRKIKKGQEFGVYSFDKTVFHLANGEYIQKSKLVKYLTIPKQLYLFGKIQNTAGLIGKVTIEKETSLYKIEKGHLVSIKKLKKGEEFGVFGIPDIYEGGEMYEVGSGSLIDSQSVKFAPIPEEFLIKANETTTKPVAIVFNQATKKMVLNGHEFSQYQTVFRSKIDAEEEIINNHDTYIYEFTSANGMIRIDETYFQSEKEKQSILNQIMNSWDKKATITYKGSGYTEYLLTNNGYLQEIICRVDEDSIDVWQFSSLNHLFKPQNLKGITNNLESIKIMSGYPKRLSLYKERLSPFLNVKLTNIDMVNSDDNPIHKFEFIRPFENIDYRLFIYEGTLDQETINEYKTRANLDSQLDEAVTTKWSNTSNIISYTKQPIVDSPELPQYVSILYTLLDINSGNYTTVELRRELGGEYLSYLWNIEERTRIHNHIMQLHPQLMESMERDMGTGTLSHISD